MMADESDDSRDVVRYWKLLNEGWDAVFGSRFVKGGGVIDYPWFKLRVNRLANFFIRMMFNISLNDTTNAFKAYRASVIKGCRPLLSPHFNLTVELPLKTIVRGYRWTVIPITWRNRRSGVPKLKLKEMGSRYLFICLYVWLEKYFSRGDYRREEEASGDQIQSRTATPVSRDQSKIIFISGGLMGIANSPTCSCRLRAACHCSIFVAFALQFKSTKGRAEKFRTVP